jgi:hypothetical protein
MLARLALLALTTAQIAPAQAPPPGDRTIPFEFDGHIFFTTHLNGVAARLLYDPIDGIYLDRRFVLAQPGWHRDWRSLGDRGPTMVGGAGPAQVEVTFTDTVSVSMGPVTHRFPRTPVIPLDSMMAGAIAGPVHGLLGTTVFIGHAVQFDFTRRTATLLDPATIDTNGWSMIPLTMIGARAVTPITITISDTLRYTMHAVVDWGMAGPFRVTTATTNRLRLLRHAGRFRSIGTGLGGGLHSRMLGDVQVHLGTERTPPLDIELAREPSGGDATPPYDALLGLGVLSRFDIIYDPDNARMLVRAPLGPAASRP